MESKKIGVLQPDFSTKMYTPQELETLEDAEEYLKMAGTIIEFLPDGTMNTFVPCSRRICKSATRRGQENC